jgi:aspartyl-tRNA(Asn)/glutamyl-tRNA(Gln) amidotransferase subunit A
MARTVKDNAILLEAMAGFDPKDSTSLDLPVPEWEAASPAICGQEGRHPEGIPPDGMNAEIERCGIRGSRG